MVKTLPRSPEINRYLIKESSLDPKRDMFDKNTLLRNDDLTFDFLALKRSETCRRFRDLQNSIVILSNGAV